MRKKCQLSFKSIEIQKHFKKRPGVIVKPSAYYMVPSILLYLF